MRGWCLSRKSQAEKTKKNTMLVTIHYLLLYVDYNTYCLLRML